MDRLPPLIYENTRTVRTRRYNYCSPFTCQAELRFRLRVLNIAIESPELTLFYGHEVTQRYENKGRNAICVS